MIIFYIDIRSRPRPGTTPVTDGFALYPRDKMCGRNSSESPMWNEKFHKGSPIEPLPGLKLGNVLAKLLLNCFVN